MLDKKVNERHEGTEEGAGEVFAVLDGGRVGRAEGNTASGPGQRRDNVGNHEDVVPVVIVGRGDVRPAATGQCAEETHGSDEPW